MPTAVHFFAAETDLPTQATAGAFGPVAGSTATQYRLGSLFTGSATANNPLAYAVVAARVVFFVSDSGPSRYNLVLRPLAAIPGLPPVKYFVYRGIRKLDFLDSTGALVAGDTCGLKAVIAAGKDGLKATESYAARAGSTPVDELFLEQENQFAIVQAGVSIGHFDTTTGFSYGFDVVLDEPGHQLTVATARKSDNVADTAAAASEDAKEAIRFAALAYLDPAAFYGLCLHSAFEVHHQAKKPYRQQEVYKLLEKFVTKNQVYVDVRDRWGLPYGLLAGSTTTLKISQSSGSAGSAAPVAYRDADQWPLHRLQNSFAATSTAGGHLHATLKLSLALDGIAHPLLQLQSGYWANLAKAAGHLEFTRLPASSGWTGDASFAVLFAKDGAATVPAATYLRAQLADYGADTALSGQVPELQPFERRPFDMQGMFAPTWPPPPAMAAVTRPGIKTLVRTRPYLTYGIHKGSGVAFRRGLAVNGDGVIAFCIRGRHFIPLESNSNRQQEAIVSNTVAAVLDITSGDYADDDFWSYLGRQSAYRYDYLVIDADGTPRYKQRALDRAVIRPCKLNLPSEGVALLEVRFRDPVVVRGHDYSPAEPFACIAYSTAERAAIDTLIADPAKFSPVGPKFLVAGAPPAATEPAGTRGHYKLSLHVRGLRYAAGQYDWASEATAIDCYSVDGECYFTPAYATAAFLRIPGVVWNNGVRPDAVPPSSNPFANTAKYAATLKPTLDTTLDALATLDRRLLEGELRDALYDDDLEALSFELAFRAPFLSERPRAVPYTQVTIDGVAKPNNPHFARFDDAWLADANALRALQTAPALGPLARTGLTQALTDAIDAARDHLTLYTVIDKDRNTTFTTQHVPAFMGRVMEDENPRAFYNPQPHYPVNHDQDVALYEAAGLAALVTSGAIDGPIKTYLTGLAAGAFGWKPLLNASPAEGFYIVKKSNSPQFNVVYDITTTKSSGITIGLGFDLGQHTLAEYNKYTVNLGFNAAAKEAVGKRKHAAVALLLQFDVDVWPDASMPYPTAVERTVTLMHDYLDTMLRALHTGAPVATRRLQVYKKTGTQEFHFPGTVQYFNEVEKAIMLSHIYNQYEAVKPSNDRGKGFIHALNTHDIRWLRLGWQRAAVDTGRFSRLQAFLERTATAAHYDFRRTAL